MHPTSPVLSFGPKFKFLADNILDILMVGHIRFEFATKFADGDSWKMEGREVK